MCYYIKSQNKIYKKILYNFKKILYNFQKILYRFQKILYSFKSLFFNDFILLYFKPSLFVSKIENNTESLTN